MLQERLLRHTLYFTSADRVLFQRTVAMRARDSADGPGDDASQLR